MGLITTKICDEILRDHEGQSLTYKTCKLQKQSYRRAVGNCTKLPFYYSSSTANVFFTEVHYKYIVHMCVVRVLLNSASRVAPGHFFRGFELAWVFRKKS
jgi:hypothetical protein